MRKFPEAFRERLQAGTAKTCLCWKLSRADMRIVAVTDHDRPVEFDGQRYEPGAALEAVDLTTTLGLAPAPATARGALSSAAITAQDLRAGLWDEARIDVYRVDWDRPQFGVHVWAGRFSEIRHGPGGFEAGLVSLKADLERPVGRRFGRRCDAVLGDARCGVDLSAPDLPVQTCDQRFETCRDVFANTANFRGFPHMPGTDFILAGPASARTS